MRTVSYIMLIFGFIYNVNKKEEFINQSLKPTIQVFNNVKSTTGTAVVIKSEKMNNGLYFNTAFSCEHVISPKITVQTYQYKHKKYISEDEKLPAACLAYDKDLDISIISFYSTKILACCKMNYSNDLDLLDSVNAVGCGFSESPRFSEGKITGLSPDKENLSTIRTNVPLVPGDSGCGLYNSKNELVGISNSIRKMQIDNQVFPVEGISIFKPVSLLKKKFDNKIYNFVFSNEKIPPVLESYLWLLNSEFQR